MIVMKRIGSLFLALMLALTACGSDSGAASPTPAGNGDISTPQPETSQPSAQTKAEIEEVLLVDTSGIKITAKQLSLDGLLGPNLQLLIENNSELNLTVQARNSAVNGYMIETMMSVDVASGKKANDTLTFLSSDLDSCGIETIADMEFSFNIFNTEGWENYLDKEQLHIENSAASTYQYSYDDSGSPIYTDDGLTIVSKGISENDSLLGPGLVLYLHNSGDSPLTVQVRDLSLNGFMVDSIFSEDILPGKHAVSTLTFLSSSLEDNNITELSELEFSFHIFHSDDWSVSTDSALITLTF